MINKKAKVLLYDIETSYTIGAVWGLYEQNVATVLREPYIISVAWKWLGERTTQVISLPMYKRYKEDRYNDLDIVAELWRLFDEADVIIAHNGNSFDQKWTYARFLVHGLQPPSPSQYVDTKVVAKSKFRFNSNSLNNLAKYLGIGKKAETGGIDLWVDCIEKNKFEAWQKMEKYNKQDVVLLEKVYQKLLPYITNHPNIALMNGEKTSCPNCGSSETHKRGFGYNRTGKYQRYQCTSCGAWSKSGITSNSQLR